MQNLHQKMPPQAWPAFQALSAAMRDAPTFEEGQRRQQALLVQYHDSFPEACRCLEDDAEASLHPLKVPAPPRQYVRTSNLAARAFDEERRRTKVIPHLWDEASFVKWVFAVLIRVRECWGKKQFSECEQHQIRDLRQSLGLDQPWVPVDLVAKDRSPRRSAASTQ
jgi:putative transposase